MSTSSQNLVGLSTAELAQLPELTGEPSFRVRQLTSWIHGRGVGDFDSMSNLPKLLRRRLAETCSLDRPEILERTQTESGDTVKLLLALADRQRIETVLIRAEGRDTICVSTQVGCAYGCRFCATGAMGWLRNLTAQEIVAQALLMREELGGAARGPEPAPGGRAALAAHGSDAGAGAGAGADSGSGAEAGADAGAGASAGARSGAISAPSAGRHFNLVFMGMGEPLANYESLIRAITVFHEDHGMAIGRRRMTVSTVGLVPRIRDLARESITVRLAVSLNATDDRTRAELMPVARTYPLDQLVPAVGEYGRVSGQRVSFEYVLLAGVNDRLSDAKRLAGFARDAGATINLIVFNTHPLSALQPSPIDQVNRFRDALLPIAPTVTLRESKGGDIRAACGQLSTAYRDSKPPAPPA